MYNSFVQLKDANIIISFKIYRNQVNSEIRLAKKTYYERLFSNIRHDPRKVWNEVQNLTRQKKALSTLEVMTDAGILHGVEAATEMNAYFVNTPAHAHDHGTVERGPTFADNSILNSITFTPASAYEFEKIITEINNKAAAGYDDIKPIPLKHVSSIISHVLAHIINLMFETAIFS